MSRYEKKPRPIGSFKGFGLLIDYLRAERETDDRTIEDLLQRSGVSLDVLRDDDVRVTREEIERLWKLAIELTGDPALPLRVASTVQRSSLGAFGYLAATSESGLDGFDRSSKLVDLMSEEVAIRLSIAGDEVVVSIHYHDGHMPRRETSEFAVGIMVYMSRHVSPPSFEPRTAHFSHPAPEHLAAYEEILRLPVTFEAPHDAVSFPREIFEQPNPEADSVLRDMIERHATQLLEELPRGERLSDRVRIAIRQLLAGGTPTIDETARALRMSARTLRRHLEHENTTFRRVLDELRREIALRALEDEGRSVDEAAQLTGFSDASAFHKAFRRWTGRSPARNGEPGV